MDRKTAAVIVHYNTAENEMRYLAGRELEILPLKMETPAGTIELKKKEVEQILDNVLKNKIIFKTQNKDRILELLSKNGLLIKYLDDPDKDMQMAAVANAVTSINYIKHPYKEVIVQYLRNKQYEAVHLGYLRQDEELFNDISKEEIEKIVRDVPAAMSGVPKELINAKLVHLFLEGLVKENCAYLEGAFSNIPEEYKDKFYWQCMCMVHGYNYSLLPKTLREEYISSKLIKYTLTNATSYVSTYWMYEHIPERLKTQELSIECIQKHFGCISHIPENFKNDEFYRNLAAADNGKMSWFRSLDIKTISKTVFQELVQMYHIKEIPDNTPSSYITSDIADILAINHNNVIPKNICTKEYYDKMAKQGLYNRIPEDELTKERCIDLVKSNKYRVLEHIPEQIKTNDFMQMVIQEEYYSSLKEIQDYLTDEIVKNAIVNGKVSSFDELPKEYRTVEMIEVLVDYSDRWLDIPEEYQTEGICKKMLKHCDKQKYEWIYMLLRMKYKTEEDIEYAILHFRDAIKIPELSREHIEQSLLRFPENILQVPKWYFDQPKIEEKHSNTKKTNNVTIAPDFNTEFIQMDIFGLLGIQV